MEKITIYNFRNLDIISQFNKVYYDGIFIESFIFQNTVNYVYSVSLFFVEIKYDSVDFKIIQITGFNSGSLLNVYSKSIFGLI